MEALTIKKFFSKVWTFFPEIWVALIAFYCVVDSSYAVATRGIDVLSPVALAGLYALLFCCIGQFFWQNKIVSIVLAVIFGLFSFYMMLAALSEFHEFVAGDPKGTTLLIVGIVLFGGTALLSFIMPWKYLRR